VRLLGGCLLAVVLAGCSVGGSESNAARFRVVIPDNNIREEGVECAGARPFRQVHRGTGFTVEDAEGEVVAEGKLPAGRAENADPTVDWGVERIPTVCVMELELDLPARQHYRFVLPDAVPLDFDAALLDRDEPVELILSG
jgi:hypothetical protein